MSEQEKTRKRTRWPIAGIVGCTLILAILPAFKMSGAAETAANATVLGALIISILRLVSRGKPGNGPQAGAHHRGVIWLFSLVFVSGALLYVALMAEFDLDSRRQPLFQQATRILLNSNMVNDYLGDSVRVGWPVHENSSEGTSSGNATLAVPVSGNRTRGTVYVLGTKSEGKWTISKMFIILKGETAKHDLLPPVSATPPIQQAR